MIGTITVADAAPHGAASGELSLILLRRCGLCHKAFLRVQQHLHPDLHIAATKTATANCPLATVRGAANSSLPPT